MGGCICATSRSFCFGEGLCNLPGALDLVTVQVESGIRADYHTGTTWAPQGCTPVVEATGKRFSLNMISAVSAQGEIRFVVHDGAVTAVVFREFLSRLMLGAREPLFLVLDGHPIHKAKPVRDLVKAQKGHLKLFYLPPYSPHLNPDEQVWAHAKRSVSKRLVQSKDEMKRLAVGARRRIQKLPELVKSFFRNPECQYALCDIYFGNLSNFMMLIHVVYFEFYGLAWMRKTPCFSNEAATLLQYARAVTVPPQSCSAAVRPDDAELRYAPVQRRA